VINGTTSSIYCIPSYCVHNLYACIQQYLHTHYDAQTPPQLNHLKCTHQTLFSQTTQLRILAGEVEPTTGDVVKSSRNLRVAFLRQEFVDELVETNTLREELYTAFQEERDLLKAISVS
jgi:hypothetical protein